MSESWNTRIPCACAVETAFLCRLILYLSASKKDRFFVGCLLVSAKSFFIPLLQAAWRIVNTSVTSSNQYSSKPSSPPPPPPSSVPSTWGFQCFLSLGTFLVLFVLFCKPPRPTGQGVWGEVGGGGGQLTHFLSGFGRSRWSFFVLDSVSSLRDGVRRQEVAVNQGIRKAIWPGRKRQITKGQTPRECRTAILLSEPFVFKCIVKSTLVSHHDRYCMADTPRPPPP